MGHRAHGRSTRGPSALGRDQEPLPNHLGGGGIPVVADRRGELTGVEAVIDKDLAASLLATALGADALLLLTDVDAVYAGWGTPAQSAVRHASPSELRELGLPAGSMGPKVEAICRFVEQGGNLGGIGSLEDASKILRGERGTIVGGPWSAVALFCAAARPPRDMAGSVPGHGSSASVPLRDTAQRGGVGPGVG